MSHYSHNTFGYFLIDLKKKNWKTDFTENRKQKVNSSYLYSFFSNCGNNNFFFVFLLESINFELSGRLDPLGGILKVFHKITTRKAPICQNVKSYFFATHKIWWHRISLDSDSVMYGQLAHLSFSCFCFGCCLHESNSEQCLLELFWIASHRIEWKIENNSRKWKC